MSLNNTPLSNRIHIGFFGKTNAGKSSLVNAVTGQDLSVVSHISGTTTDPVTKTMEILPLGPVAVIDTPGFDDSSELGEKRMKRAKDILKKTDIAVLVVDGGKGIADCDKYLIALFDESNIPYVIAYTKSDMYSVECSDKNEICVSSKTGEHIFELKEMLAHFAPKGEKKAIVSDLLEKGSVAVLVTPIDESAPKGRLILPQQQVIRDILDGGSMAVVTRETELEQTLAALKSPPAMVITDSQAFEYVAKIVPDDVKLTSFSILMARYKGFLQTAIDGINAIDSLSDGDTVLIAEGCTHHRQCNDIGTVKIPRWLQEHTKKKISIKTCSGGDFPEDLSDFAVIIHCGGCMLNEREVQSRMNRAIRQGIPFTNYGILIAHMKGILERSIKDIAI